MYGLIKKELGYADIRKYYLTGSQVVFGYLKNSQTEFSK